MPSVQNAKQSGNDYSHTDHQETCLAQSDEISHTPTRKCKNCDNRFDLKNIRRFFCSPKCVKRYAKKHEPDSKSRRFPNVCHKCNKSFLGKKVVQKFCSLACHHENNKVERVKKDCIICKTSFEIIPSLDANGSRKYCSKSCQNKDPKIVQHLRKLTRDQQKLAMTSIEKIGYEILDEIGEAYTPQKMLAGRFCVDAVLTDIDLVIQFDGDYWHGNPDKFPEPSKLQKKRMHLDRSQDMYLKKCGFSILRIWECDINGDPSKVRARIRRRIREMKACAKRSKVTTGGVRRKHISGEIDLKIAA